MAINAWLPKGFGLSDCSKIDSLLFWGERWQIFDTDGINTVLLALPDLAQKWNEEGLFDDILLEELFSGGETFKILFNPKMYELSPVESGKSFISKTDALAFALALRESRKISSTASFHDAVYVERYSRLLPCWTMTPQVADEVVLGTWLTNGVAISTNSFRRLIRLAGWLSPKDLAKIVTAAGFRVPDDAVLSAREKIKPASERNLKTLTRISDIASEEKQEDVSKTFHLPGRPQLENFFNEHVIDIVFNPQRYSRMGIEFPSAIVLHGPPGCGKTFAVERLVEFLDWPSYSIAPSNVGSPYIHETSKKIAEVFNKAIKNAPSVVILDEMESLLLNRGTGNTSGLHHLEEISEFLRYLPLATKNKVLVIAMTNRIDMIDPAILRRGRFDHIVEVGMPSRSEVILLLDSLLEKLPVSQTLNMDAFVEALDGKALSDTVFVIREAARLAARFGKTQIDQESIDVALCNLHKGREKDKPLGFTAQ
jgi:SpoVK/Ycf46/Vps4 family AAA+-type ATPase